MCHQSHTQLYMSVLRLCRVPVQVSHSGWRSRGISTTLAYFPVRTGLKQLETYFRGLCAGE